MELHELVILFAVLVAVAGFLLLAGVWAQLRPSPRTRKIACRYCGTQAPAGTGVCPYCGHKIQE